MKTSIVFTKIAQAVAGGASVVVNKGGTRSGKTWASLQFLTWYAQTFPALVVSIVGETMPFLKRGAIRDLQTMLGKAWRPEAWNASNSIYTLPNGSQLEFFSVEDEGKIHGSARDVLFINECFFIKFDVYRQLAMRTRLFVLLDYNPRARFWVDDHILGRDDAVLIHSTYKDNPYLTPRQIAEIEAYKNDANFWRVYGLGETGSVEGLIYTNWDVAKEMPAGRRSFWCIDFGFTNDPTAILHVAESGGELYVDEIAYSPGMSNAEIAKTLKDYGATKADNIVADSSEPKSITEINAHGLRVIPAKKGQGSIMAGIGAVQKYKLHVTARSTGTINELRNYMWRRDTNGEWINTPVDKFNHALDALRYGVTSFLWNTQALQRPRVRLTPIC